MLVLLKRLEHLTGNLGGLQDLSDLLHFLGVMNLFLDDLLFDLVLHFVNLVQGLLDMSLRGHRGSLGHLVLQNMLELLEDGDLGVQANLMLLHHLADKLMSMFMTDPIMATFAFYENSISFAEVNRDSFMPVMDHSGAMSDSHFSNRGFRDDLEVG